MSGRNSDGTGVVDRVVRILEVFERYARPLTLVELSRESGLARTTTHRIVTSLEANGLVTRTADDRFGLGIRLWEIAQRAGRQLLDAARPFLQDLFSLTGETTQLAVREGDEVLYIERLYGTRRVPRASRVGGRLPMHATAVGKSILAFEEDWVREAYLSKERFVQITPSTVGDRDALRRDLEEVSRRGYATTAEEARVGSSSIAVPVFQGQRVVAALGLVTNAEQAGTLDRFVPALQGTSRRIERATARFPWETVITRTGPSGGGIH